MMVMVAGEGKIHKLIVRDIHTYISGVLTLVLIIIIQFMQAVLKNICTIILNSLSLYN